MADLDVARPLADRDRVEIARRRAHEQARRPDPEAGPLATGRAARELVDRARRWAAAHPDWTVPAQQGHHPSAGATPAEPEPLG